MMNDGLRITNSERTRVGAHPSSDIPDSSFAFRHAP